MPFAMWDLDAAFAEFLREATYEVARAQSGVISGMGRMESASTVSTVVSGDDGAELDLPSRPVDFTLSIDVRAVRSGDFDQLAVEIDGAAEKFGKALVELFVDTMSKVTEFTGNTVTSEGGFTFEAHYKMLDQREWSLDDDDALVLPTLMMHPDTANGLPYITPEQKAAIQELKERKLEELLARRRRRRLS